MIGLGGSGPERAGPEADGLGGGTPWMVFADLMSGLLGLVVLLFVVAVVQGIELGAEAAEAQGAQSAAEATLAAEASAREAAEARARAAEAARAAAQARLDAWARAQEASRARMAGLESALGASLTDGRITLVDGRIGIAGAVLFDSTSAELLREGRVLLREIAGPLAAWLAQHDELVMVGGFTDNRPIRGEDRPFEDNWALSAERALTVVRALIAAGVPPERLFAAGFGASHPVGSNAEEEGRARNRRVEIVPQRRGQHE